MHNKHENNIPKIIHYCWFGKGEKPLIIQNYIRTWQESLPNYQLIEWNEDNFDININSYVKEAYQKRKFAFVSDVARLYALKTMGGVYFDTDIEVRQDITPYLESNSAVFAFESNTLLMTGFFAASKGHKVIIELLDEYRVLEFIYKDGSLNLTANTIRTTEKLLSKGLILNGCNQYLGDGIKIYNNELFGAYDVDNSRYNVKDKTVLIHHYEGSWLPLKDKNNLFLKKTFSKILGKTLYGKLREVSKFARHFINSFYSNV